MLTLFALFALLAACGADDKPAPVGSFGSAEWPAQVDREFAEADGLTPDDFDWMLWPVSNVRVRVESIEGEDTPTYHCRIPADTPQADQYDNDNEPLPDPVGLALAWVRFELQDVDAGDVASKYDAGHVNGKVFGEALPHSVLWQRLTPGTSLRVRLTAAPFFYYLTNDGAAHLEYALENDGYFSGAEMHSPTYTLSMNQDGEVSIQ